MVYLGREDPNVPCDILLEEGEWKAAYAVIHHRPPPDEPPPLSEGVWLIVKLGGHLGPLGGSPPGPMTIWRGLCRAHDLGLGFGVGWKLRERAPRKRVNLELGNATPVIVEADADIDDAAARCAANAFSFAGQSCISVQRVYVQREAYDAFRAAFVPRVEALVVGDPADEATDVGPLISQSERDRVLAWIGEARDGGGAVLTGGRLDDGLLLPTVVEQPGPGAKLSCDEAFGPVCTLQPYDTLDEAIDAANATRYGLQAGIFTASLKTALEASRRLEFGGVTVNEAPTFRADQMPYGGVKDSGNTREGPAWAVREMTEERLVVVQL